MRFFKALQRSEVERPESESSGPPERSPESDGIVGKVPRLIGNPDLKIGGAKPEPISPLRQTKSASPVLAAGRESHYGVSDQVLASSSRFEEAAIDLQKVNPHLIAIVDPNSPFSEEYRILRTHLLQERQRRGVRSVAVVSVAPAEGKSVTAANLTWLLCQTEGVSALLIDADLRRPSLATYLGLEVESGLSEFLSGEASLEESVLRLGTSGLHLLPGGKVRSDAAEQISGPRLPALLDEVSALFDFVILDAPPLNVFTDAKVLVNHVDGALLVIKANHTSYKEVDRVLDGLPRDRMLGIVLNQSDETLVSGNYYKYPYYSTP